MGDRVSINVRPVAPGQEILAADYNRLAAAINLLSNSLGATERRGTGTFVPPVRDFDFINKLKATYNDGGEEEDPSCEVWIYAPTGSPSLFYPGTMLVWTGSSTLYPGALEWRVPAYVDPELSRDGDWVNTGISLAPDAGGLIYARIDSGAVVKFSLDVPTDGDSGSAGVDPKPYIAIGSIDSGKALNFVVGVQGISGGIFHDAVVAEGD